MDCGPCKENKMNGDAVDLFKFPAPKFFPGTVAAFSARPTSWSPRTRIRAGSIVGTYRLQLLGQDVLGTQFIKGKHADIMLKKYQAMKKPMPVAVVVGCDPFCLSWGRPGFPPLSPNTIMAGSIRNAPIEVVKCETNDLIVPATAEIVVEGEVDAEAFMPEGPFGEYTGYYSGVGTDPRNFIKVNCVTHRNNPIFMSTTVGRAVTDSHMTLALAYGASLWQQLVAMKIPGLKAVYCPPGGCRTISGHHFREADVSRDMPTRS